MEFTGENSELQSANEEQEVYFEVVDEDNITHRLLLLSIFTAGNLHRKYAAGMTADIVIYRYVPILSDRSECKHYIQEIESETELAEASARFDEYVAKGIAHEDMREMTFYIELPDDEGGTVDFPVVCTVYKIFELPRYARQYVVGCPTNIMFFRYNEIQKDGQDFIEFSNIYNSQEYEDVAEEFNQFILSEEKN